MPAGLHAAHIDLVVNVLVDVGELLLLLAQTVDLIAHAHGVALADELVAQEGQRTVVGHLRGDELYAAGRGVILARLVEVEGIDLLRAVPDAQEVDGA